MLNISPVSVRPSILKERYSSLKYVESRKSGKAFIRVLLALLIAVIIIAFLPWTQNIRSTGKVTTVDPDQRPQSVPTLIDARIEKWYVREGDYVNKGDTILFISEIKESYVDPNLLQRTQEQLDATESKAGSYMDKVKATDKQIDALLETMNLKQQQAENMFQQALIKVQSDSIDYEAAVVNHRNALTQYQRFEQLYKDGLRSLTDLENRETAVQKANASMVSAENKLLISRNEVLNAEVQLATLGAEYRDAISKAEADKFTAMSNMYDAEASVTKLQNQYMNYSVRRGMYHITAPQAGYITEAVQAGIGHAIKPGETVVTIMPAKYDLAIEMYVRPFDLPLLSIGSDVQIQFDGWPAIVFSGWPDVTFGTYKGKIFAIDNFIGKNGMFRVLVSPDENSREWPQAVRVGSGTTSLVLLKEVPIWYEVWRQINGFPPDFYNAKEEK